MVDLVIVLIGILLLIAFGNIVYRIDWRMKERKARRWLASQPPEILTSWRRRAAERARALLQAQNGYYGFLAEFGQSQDPQIQKLVAIVDEFCRAREQEDECDLETWFKNSMEERILELESIKVGNEGQTPS